MAATAPPPPGELKARPDHLSFSQITKLSSRYDRSCPRSWAYGYLLGIPWKPGKAMQLGKALDTAVETFLGRILCGDPWQLAHTDALDALQRTMDESAEWPAELSDQRQDYTVMVAGAFTAFVEEYFVARGVKALSIQTPHSFFVRTGVGEETRKVIGFSDWIEEDGTIVDLKFSGSTHWNRDGEWNQDWLVRVHDQLTTYYMGRLSDQRSGKPAGPAPVVPKGRVVVATASINRKTPVVKWHDFDLSAVDVATLADAAREADALARAEAHAPRPGPACALCDYQDRCRADNARQAVRTADLAL